MATGPFTSESTARTSYEAATDQARVSKKSKIAESGSIQVTDKGTFLSPGSTQLAAGARQTGIDLTNAREVTINNSSDGGAVDLGLKFADAISGLAAKQNSTLENLLRQQTGGTGASAMSTQEVDAAGQPAATDEEAARKKKLWLALAAVAAFAVLKILK